MIAPYKQKVEHQQGAIISDAEFVRLDRCDRSKEQARFRGII
jgi:hypothetical protein